MVKLKAVFALLLLSTQLTASNQIIQKITGDANKVETRKLCHDIFINIEDTSIYSHCKVALKYQSWASASDSAMNSAFGTGALIGLIGLIPYAQNKSITLFVISGAIIGLGFLAIIPKYYFNSLSLTQKRKTIQMYNDHIEKKSEAALIYKQQLFSIAFTFRI